MNVKDRLLVEAQCIQLSHAFAFHLDQGDYPALAEQFATAGIWLRHGEELQGRETIIAAMNDRPPDRFARHLTTNIHFTSVAEHEAAAVVSNISFFAKHAGGPPADLGDRQCMIIEFWDHYTREGDCWLIKRRDTRPIMLPAHMFDAMLGKH